MESLFTSSIPLIREAWIYMWLWYKYAVNRPPPTSRVTINHMIEDRVELYRHVPSPGQSIPVGITPFPVDNSVLDDKEIAWEVRRLHLNHSGGS